MTFEEILKTRLVRMPISLKKNETYEEKLREILIEMLTLVKSSDHLSDIPEFKPEVFKERFEILVNGILGSLQFYYAGSPVKAYEEFSRGIEESFIRSYLPPDFGIKEASSFFRVRKSQSNYSLNKCDLFHVPFEKRRKLGTQRFSIPGFPILYLSSSIYVAWEEMRRPDFRGLQAVRLVNKKYLRCIDLTTDKYKESYVFDPPPWITTDKQLDDLYAVMAWPLIAACSFQVSSIELPFKPEYIIPQLLLQYVSKDPSIDGVKFSSTHINLNSKHTKGNMFNLAIPVKESKDSGFCSELMSIFDSTEVVGSWIVDMSSAGGEMWSPDEKVGETTQSIELVKGGITHYPYTKFGHLESYLFQIEAGPIMRY